jgi:hypothetical protein
MHAATPRTQHKGAKVSKVSEEFSAKKARRAADVSTNARNTDCEGVSGSAAAVSVRIGALH